jgi:spermidine synthase
MASINMPYSGIRLSHQEIQKVLVLVGVFFLSASLLALEVLLVRLLSILLYPLATYMVISLALLGYGIGATAMAVRKSDRFIKVFQAGKASIILAVVVVLSLLNIWIAGEKSWSLLLLPVVLSLPFAFGGLAISIILSIPDVPVNKIYFADLIGAGAGAAIVMVGIEPLGGIKLGLMISLLVFIAAMFFYAQRLIKFKFRLILIALLAGLSLLAVKLPYNIIPVAPKELRYFVRLGSQVKWEFQGWNPLARVDVLSLPGDRVELPQSFAYKLVTQDGGAPSIVLNITTPKTDDFAEHTIFGIPYWIKDQPKVLIIGLGGGPDVQTALHYGARRITGVEINAKMIDIVQNRFSEFSGNPYTDPRVRIVEGDGRHFVRLSREKYDIIQLTGVDTSVASLGGNPNLAENYLYTVQAFREFYRHLSADGTLSVSFPDVDGLGLRLVALATEALSAEGIEGTGNNIMVSLTGGFVHVLIKRAPFTSPEVEVIRNRFDAPMTGLYFPLYHRLFGTPSKDFFSRHEVLYFPGTDKSNIYSAFFDHLDRGQVEEYLRSQDEMVLPSTDDWPFFFVLDKRGAKMPNLWILSRTLFLLFVIGLTFVLLPLMVFKKRRFPLKQVILFVPYFAALGFGFIFLEVVFIQKFSLFLGHPTYALIVTLCTLLIASGLGSLLGGWQAESDKVGNFRLRLAVAAGGISILILLMNLCLDPLFDRLLGWSLVLRTIISVIVIALPGFLMGIPFPSGLALVKSQVSNFVPWAWAINNVATVMGTIAAVFLAMMFGFSTVLLLTAGCYFLVLLFGTFASRLLLKI